MIGKRRGLVLLATTALCVAALVPVRVGDARVAGWVEIFQQSGLVLQRAGSSLRQAYLGFGWWHKPSKPTLTAATPGCRPGCNPPYRPCDTTSRGATLQPGPPQVSQLAARAVPRFMIIPSSRA